MVDDVGVVAVVGWGYQASAFHQPLQFLNGRLRCSSVQELAQRCSPDGVISGSESQPSSLAVALAEQIGEKPTDVIGWSTGAMLALEVAAHWPERVRRLVLFAATGSFCSRESSCGRPEYCCGVASSQVRAMRRGIRRDTKRVLGDFISRAGDSDGTHCIADTDEGTVGGLERGLDFLLKADLRDCLASVESETLLVHGTADSIVPHQAARYLFEHLPMSRLELLEGAAHCLWLKHLGEVQGLLKGFLENGLRSKR